MKRELIARITYEVNSAYAAALGEPPRVPWHQAAPEVKGGVLSGVDMRLDNPDASLEDQHTAWMESKAKAGWKYGEVLDEAAKTHPCMLPYDQLPPAQRAKDAVFVTLVRELAAVPDEAPAAQANPEGTAKMPAGAVLPVKYIGKRDSYRDGAYATGIVFQRDQSRNVPAAIAVQMLKHKDVYAPGDVVADTPAVPPAKEADKEEVARQELRDAIQAMTTKKAVVAFTKTNFNVDLDDKHSLVELRAEATNYVDRFGAT